MFSLDCFNFQETRSDIGGLGEGDLMQLSKGRPDSIEWNGVVNLCRRVAPTGD